MSVRFHAVALILAFMAALALTGVADPVWAGPVEDAQALMNAGRMPQAEQTLRTHLAANPGDRQARLILAGALAAQGKLDAAYAEYQALLDENAGDGVGLAVATIFSERGASAADAKRVQALFPQVQQAMQARDMERAVQVLEEIVNLAPGNAPARTNLAQVLMRMDRLADAVGHLEAVFELNPKDAQSGTLLAEAYERNRQPSEAAATYKRILKYWPKHVSSLFALGRLAFFNDRDYTAAAEWLERLLKVAPGHADAAYLLGLARDQLGDSEAARAAYQRAIKADPKYYKAQFQLGLMYEREGREAESLEAFRAVVKFGGNSSEAQQAGRRLELFGGDVETARQVREKTSLAVRAMEAGDLDTARTLLEEILSLVPNNVLARYNLATVYSQTGDNDKAIEQLKAAIAVDPGHYLSYYGLALIYQGSGQFEQAYEAYQNVLKTAPRQEPRRQVADIMVKELSKAIERYSGMRESRDSFLAALDLAQKDDFKGAIEKIERAIALDPTNPYYHYNAAIFYWELGQADKSYKELREAVKYKPDHVQSHFRLGLFFLAAGVDQEAVASFEKVLEYGTDEPEVAEARRRLAEVRGVADGKEKAVAYLLLGRQLAQSGNRQAAVQAYLRGYQLDPTHRKLIEVLAEALMSLRREDEALHYLEQGIRRDSRYLPYYFNEGQIFKARKQYDRAIQALERALEISPTHKPSMMTLSKVYEENGQVDEALALLTKLLDATPDDERLLLEKGRMLARHERYTEAAALYDWYLAGHDETVALLVDRGLMAEKVSSGVTVDEAAVESGTEPRYATASEWFQRAIAIAGPADAKLANFARTRLAEAKKWNVTLNQTVLDFNTNANNSAIDPQAGASSAVTFSMTYTPYRNARLSLPLTFSTSHRLHYTFQTYVSTTTLKGGVPLNFSRLNVAPEGRVSMVRNQRGTTSVSYVGYLSLSGRLGFPKTTSLTYTRTEFVSYLNARNNYLQNLYTLRVGHDLPLGKRTRVNIGSTRTLDSRTAVSAILDVERTDHYESLGLQRTMSKGRVLNLSLGYSGSREDRLTNFLPGDPTRTPVPIITRGASASGSYSFRPYPRVTAVFSGSWGVTRFLHGIFQAFPQPEGNTTYSETQQDQVSLSASLRFTYQASDKARWVVELSQNENRVSVDIPADLEATLTGNIQQENINKQQSLTVSMSYSF